MAVPWGGLGAVGVCALEGPAEGFWVTGPRGKQCAQPRARCFGKLLAGLRQQGAGGGMGEAWVSRRRLEFGRESVLTGSKRSPWQ